jgi:hypothetical protein
MMTATNANGPFEMGEECWKTRKEKFKEDFSQLTDEDLNFENGKENELLGRIEARLNENCEKGHYIVYHVG